MDVEKKNYAWPITTLCKYDYFALQKCLDRNRNVFQDKKIVIMGAGIRGTSFAIMLKKFGYCNIIFSDNNEIKVGGVINEYPIVSYEEVVEHINEEVVIISVENGFSIKQQLEQSGFVENQNFFYIENHLYDLYVNEFLSKQNHKYLIMGDCGITDLSAKDDNFTNLGELLKEKLGADVTKVLAIHAMGMRAFYHILKAQIKYVEKPETVVVMTNFETFTSKQYLLPRSQHAGLIKRISDSIDNQDQELREYAEVTQSRFDNFKVDYFASSQNTLRKMSKSRNDRLIIQMNYMYELKENNEHIAYLKKMIKMCETYNINLLFFVPPVNYMYASELFGDVFMEKYQSNVLRLRSFIPKDIALLDLSFLLTNDQFADLETIDETANYNGRMFVASKIVEKVELMT